MTRILCSLLVLFITVAAQSQVQKGAVLLGGQLAYNSSTLGIPPSTSSRSGAYNVSIGKAIKENSVFGLNISYSPLRYDFLNVSNVNTLYKRNIRDYNAGIFYRSYKQIFGKFYAFAEGDISYTRRHQTDRFYQTSNKSEETETGGRISIMPGMAYNVFRKLQVELNFPNLFAIGYRHNSTGVNNFSINTGLQNTSISALGVGFHFIL